MGFFGQGRARLRGNALPGNIVEMMERFGRSELNPAAAAEPDPWTDLQAPLLAFARADPDGFTAVLARAVLPVGGWAATGAERTVWNLLPPESRRGPAYEALLDATVEFLRQSGLPPARTISSHWEHWVSRGGTVETWLPIIEPPAREAARLTPLRPGEPRPLARLAADAEANLILVRAEGDHYEAIIEQPRSDTDRRRVWSVLRTAESQYDLYLDIGLSLQAPQGWHDPELAPFFPLRAPDW